MALCDRLEAQKSDAESAHIQLVRTVLENLAQSTDTADFTSSWERIKDNFDILFSTQDSIDALKQTLLQLAVTGRLVPQNKFDEPARELVERLKSEKLRLDVANKTKKGQTIDPQTINRLFSAPVNWEWVPFNDVVTITSGVTLGKNLEGKKTISRPYLRVANVQRGYLVLDEIKEIDILPEQLDKYLLKENDLLLTEGGDWDKVGRTAIWRGEIPECLHQNHIFKARTLLPELYVSWAALFLNSPVARSYFEGSAKQTTNLASINMSQLRRCPFALPPIAEQHRILAKVDELMGLCDAIKAALEHGQNIHDSFAKAVMEKAVSSNRDNNLAGNPERVLTAP